MFRYINLNSSSNENPQEINKKNQKTVPISLLSGGNSFFVKIKSNQIASNYNETGNRIKPYPNQKENNTYFDKDNKNKSYNKYLNNPQKNSYVFTVNNSIEYNTNHKNNNKSIINKSKPDLLNKNGIYSFTTNRKNGITNDKSINSSSYRQNYNGVLITDVELLKKNMNNNYNIYEDKQNVRKSIKEKNEKYNNNTINYKLNKKIINNNRANNTITSNSLNRKIRTLTEKNSILTDKNNNQIKLFKKSNQYTLKNNNNIKNNLKNKNLTNIIFNNYSTIERSIKNKSSEKNNYSEGKNKVIFQGPKKNKIICYKKLSNNTTNIFKENLLEADDFNNSLSRRRIEKRIKLISSRPNEKAIRVESNSKNTKSNFNTINNKSLIVQKKYNNNQNIINKTNDSNNKNDKLKNSFVSRDIFNLNYTLTELIGPNSNNYKNKANKHFKKSETNGSISSNKYLMKKFDEGNNQNIYKIGNKYISSDSSSYNLDGNNNNYPNIIINNNYLYNYMPLVTLNNSRTSIENDSKKVFKNSLIENKIINKNKNLYKNSNNLSNKNNSLNNSQNIKIEHPHAYIYSSFVENNSKNKNYNRNTLSKENKSRVNKKYKKDQDMKINIIDSYSHKTYLNNNLLNHQANIGCSNTLDRINDKNKTNRSDYNLFINNTNSNNVIECYVSKEKNNKKPKQNPPLNKNPKKLNILSLIQENNKKIKDNNSRHSHQFHSFAENDNYNKRYNRNKNICETIDYILHPEAYKIKNDAEVLDNFDDMNTIIKRIDFENVDLKSVNIFTVNEDENPDKKEESNYLYKRYSEYFNSSFDKKFIDRKNMSASQNKTKNNYHLYHSKQSGSTKDSNKESSSTKKFRIFSNVENIFEKK